MTEAKVKKYRCGVTALHVSEHDYDAVVAKLKKANDEWDQRNKCVELLERNAIESLKENKRLRDALVQIKTVCIDNESDTCDKKLTLNFVYQVVTSALLARQPPEQDSHET